MNKIFIVLLFILLGSSLIVINNIKGTAENSFNIVYENNKNEALPNVSNSIEIIDGYYRLYDIYGNTIDYNVYTGVYTLTKTTSNAISYELIQNLIIGQQYTIKIHVVSTDLQNFQLRYLGTEAYRPLLLLNNYQETFTATRNSLIIGQSTSEPPQITKFKLQLEKGPQSTSYIVPKLIPHYQDNLSLEEKEKIGFGAFGGVTQIIKTINDIIKPVGDFINGILSWF